MSGTSCLGHVGVRHPVVAEHLRHDESPAVGSGSRKRGVSVGGGNGKWLPPSQPGPDGVSCGLADPCSIEHNMTVIHMKKLPVASSSGHSGRKRG